MSEQQAALSAAQQAASAAQHLAVQQLQEQAQTHAAELQSASSQAVFAEQRVQQLQAALEHAQADAGLGREQLAAAAASLQTAQDAVQAQWDTVQDLERRLGAAMQQLSGQSSMHASEVGRLFVRDLRL